jgi:hypothetical protein
MPDAHPTLSPTEIILKMIAAMNRLIDGSAVIVNKYVNQPLANSIALNEMNSFADRGLVEDAYARASLCFENAADHLMAFSCTLQEPAKTLSPYTCLRSLLESSSLALWLLDVNIDVRERVGRCFGFRYKEFKEQIKFFEADRVNSHEAQIEIDKVNKRMTVVENKAIALGYPQLSKNGKMTGIVTHMPETVGLVKLILDRESEYRLLSSVAHSYLWATRQVGFKLIEATDANGQTIKAVEKHIHPEMILFGINLAVPTFARVFWTIGKLYGWDMQEVEGLLNQVFDEIGFKSNVRFWRQSWMNE